MFEFDLAGFVDNWGFSLRGLLVGILEGCLDFVTWVCYLIYYKHWCLVAGVGGVFRFVGLLLW